MELLSFFNSYPGLYIVQSFIYSIVASLIVEIAITTWEIRNPAARQRFFLMVMVLPVVSLPVYHLINPHRDSIYFRLGALLDSTRWLHIEIGGLVPVSLGIFFLFAVTSLVFLFQEMVPIVRHAFASKDFALAGKPAEKDSPVSEALRHLDAEKTDIFVLEDDDAYLFSTTGKKGSVYLSEGLLRVLDAEQLRTALAHELAHVSRSRRPFLLLVYLLRVALFFNPIVLMEFRRIVQEDEKICDDMAVSAMGTPGVLSETLRKLYIAEEDREPPGKKGLLQEMEEIETYSHRLNIESRIARLDKGYANTGGKEWFAFSLAAAVAMVINYWVV